jgi:hypothetical protein
MRIGIYIGTESNQIEMRPMRRQFICFALLVLLVQWGIFASSAQTRGAHAEETQKVFTDLGLPDGDVVMDIYKEQLRMREPTHLSVSWSCYLEDGLKFCKDLKEIESNYKKYSVEDKLVIRDGVLYFESAEVLPPRGVQMRLIWQAVLWKGWVICLGRTSETDKPANMTPPFFATELITFRASERKVAKVKYLSGMPPAGTRLYILSPMK